MKVSINEAKKGSFEPYTVTFLIESKEDSARFHDKVATALTGKPHEFNGEIFKRSQGEVLPDYQGEI